MHEKYRCLYALLEQAVASSTGFPVKMLKKNQCWRCDAICTTPSPKIDCTGCEVASYCSQKCRDSDLFRHHVDCQTVALKRTCSGCAKEGTGLKQCGSCMKAWYCDQTCLKKSWPTHKVYCHKITRKTSEMSDQIKKYYDFIEFTPGTASVYYWGNIPAVDLINFPLNEGSEYSKPFSVLVCGVGDPRNIVLSLPGCPSLNFRKLIKKSSPLF